MAKQFWQQPRLQLGSYGQLNKDTGSKKPHESLFKTDALGLAPVEAGCSTFVPESL